jgi:hypothetical protein
MNRNAFALITSLIAFSAASAAYADYVESVRTQLQQLGFQQISVSSTLLGRSHIVAKSKSGTREIIMNPRTGEILRDLWSSSDGGTGPSIVGVNDDSEDDDGKDSGKGKNDDGGDDSGDDDGGDDGGDDDGGDDNGGKGEGGDDSGGDDGGDDGGNDD